jgi:hypothetical protein
LKEGNLLLRISREDLNVENILQKRKREVRCPSERGILTVGLSGSQLLCMKLPEKHDERGLAD